MNQTKLTNEVDSLSIQFADLFDQAELRKHYRWAENRLFIAIEASDGDRQQPVAASGLNWDYSCMDGLSTRAIRAEEGELLMRGKRVKAEDYLLHWEKVSKAPVSLGAALARGIQPIAVLTRPAQGFGGKRPEGQQAATLALSSQHLVQSGGGQLRWDIPLTGKAIVLELDAIGEVDYDYRAPEGGNLRCEVRRVPSLREVLVGTFTADLFGETL